MAQGNNKKSSKTTSAEIIVLLSGGIDSAVCLDIYSKLGRPVCGLFVNYGQLAAVQEEKAAKDIAAYFSTYLLTAAWKGITQKKSGLIQGRNGFLIMAALMELPLSVSGIAMGIHAGTSYADCSFDFFLIMQKLVNFYTNNSVEVLAPLIDWRKEDIYKYCTCHKIPMHLTYSCERGEEKPCGECLSCKDKELLHVSP